ncbi:M12 family metallo-peptidase [Exilibacterium tricleocarpae]|uniref:M12 family metallo-peptidase n=1 Tax=Exilibacterium tricleocarpae TaxID=2591008 RepID=UPI0015D22EF6|nr:M12 family metallo-peptidase [Exilibacterium tricleocarpae]
MATVAAQLFSLQGSTAKQALAADTLVASLAQDASVVSTDAIALNAALLDGATSALLVAFGPGRTYSIEQSRSYWINPEYQAWTGKVDVGALSKGRNKQVNRAVFVRSENNVFGQINIDGRTFEIMTTEAGKHLLVERDFSQLGVQDDTPALELPTLMDTAKISVGEVNMVAPTVIRLLQVTSSNALSRFGTSNMVARMNFFLAQANDVYANNGVPIVLQDAGKYSSGRTELSSVTANTIAIRAPNDGYLDQFAGSLRNSTGADLVGHITDNSGDGLCGRVNAIGGGQSNGFFVTRYICTNFTFVHEIGHLFGARHDNDPTTTPFAFGHGFVNSGRNFRTVMAVSSNPQPRIGFFSTDDQTFNGGALGNSSFSDNERVHVLRRNTMAGFR